MTDFQSEMKSFSRRLELLQAQLEVIKKLGINEDILVAYLCHNLKISEKRSREILASIEEFFDKLMKEGMAKKLSKTIQ